MQMVSVGKVLNSSAEKVLKYDRLANSFVVNEYIATLFICTQFSDQADVI